MSLYPHILPLKAYRYIPFKDETPKNYIDFICIRWINESEYLLMVLNDKLDFDGNYFGGCEGQYGDIEVKDWHVDLKEIKIRKCDIDFAKLMGL